MKNKIFKTAFILTVISFISSCAIHTGYMTNSASLSSNNFAYVKRDITGTAMATYVFGFGGLTKTALVDEAKKDMLKASPLKDNQTLVNLTVNWKKTFVFPFAITNRCIVTADIVEFKAIETYKKDVISDESLIESDPEKQIKKVLANNQLHEYIYLNFEEVKIGDIVKFTTSYDEVVYGIIVEKLDKNKIIFNTYPSLGQPFAWEEKYTNVKVIK